MDNTPNLALPLLANKQALQTTFHDEALKTLDALVMLSVIDRDLSSPPPSPNEGDRYLVRAPGSGDPAWLDDRIVVYLDGNWMALAPRRGWTCYVEDEGALIAWDGAAWQPALDVLGGGAANNLALLGVGTTADAVNPFSAKLNNALWVARTLTEGGDGDLRYKMSKEGAANTLSVLFQSNFSGRAEIGLTGDDDFHFKVSPDGSAWHDGIVIDKDTGAAAFPNTPAQIARRCNVLTPHEGLVCKYAGTTTVGINADAVVLFDSSGGARRFTGLDETLDVTASGANGLDSGAEDSSRWYHIWAIGKDDGTLDGLLSESASAPTLPGGYTYKGYVGAVYNDSSSNFIPFIQRGRRVWFVNGTAIITAGAATSWGSISLAAFVPPTATCVWLQPTAHTSTGGPNIVRVDLSSSDDGSLDQFSVQDSADTAGRTLGAVCVPIQTPTVIYYQVSGTNARLSASARGFEF